MLLIEERAGPRAGVDYPRTYQQFRSWFADEASCVAYLEQLRWPAGFVCPRCDATSGWRTARGLWMCAECGRKTSVTAGTIFHRSHSPLTTWFAAIWFVCSQKNGVSALGLQRVLGFGSYETAWAWLHKLRRAMVRPDRDQLAGIVELDETEIGGRTRQADPDSTEKVPVMVAVERVGERGFGRVRLATSWAPNSSQLLEFAHEVIAPGSTIRTDGLRILRKLGEQGFTHEYTNMYSSKAPAHEVLPGVHLVASLLKRWLIGTLHYGASPKHMDYYLDEFTFRFNRRSSGSRGLLFYRLLQQAVETDPHPLNELVKG